MHFKVSWGCLLLTRGGGGGLLNWAIEIISRMKKGYSNNLMLKNTLSCNGRAEKDTYMYTARTSPLSLIKQVTPRGYEWK